MHNRIYMTAMVHGERPDGKKGYPKVKGSFLLVPMPWDLQQNIPPKIKGTGYFYVSFLGLPSPFSIDSMP